MVNQVSVVPLLYIGDADSYGADIFFQYAFGNLNSAFDNCEVNVPAMKWIGPFIQDFTNVSGMMELNEKD